MASFGDALLASRKRAGISQRELARLISVHPSHVTRLENGRITHPRAETARRISKALDDPDLLVMAARFWESKEATISRLRCLLERVDDWNRWRGGPSRVGVEFALQEIMVAIEAELKGEK